MTSPPVRFPEASVLSALDAEALAALASVVTSRRLAAGERLYRQGEPGNSLAIVAEGRLQVRMRTPFGADADVAELGSGELAGEMSCFDPAPRSATVEAVEASAVLELDHPGLERLRASAPTVAAALTDAALASLCRRIRRTHDLIAAELDRLHLGSPPLARPGAAAFPPHWSGPPDTAHPVALAELRETDCLRDLCDADLEELLRAAPPIRFSDEEVICREGEPSDACYVLVRGGAELRKDLAGAERIVGALPPGTICGQPGLVDGAPRPATVRVRGDGVILALGRTAFRDALDAGRPFAVHLHAQLAVAGARQLRMANDRLSTLFGAPPRGAAPRPAPAGAPPSPPAMAAALTYIQTALGEWDLDLDE